MRIGGGGGMGRGFVGCAGGCGFVWVTRAVGWFWIDPLPNDRASEESEERIERRGWTRTHTYPTWIGRVDPVKKDG